MPPKKQNLGQGGVPSNGDILAARIARKDGINAILRKGNIANKILKARKSTLSEKSRNEVIAMLLLEDGSCDMTLGELMANESLSFEDAVDVMNRLRGHVPSPLT